MSSLTKSALVLAFLTDHRQFMMLLRNLGVALDTGELQHARRLAQELNEVGGPHIAFEESVLYPALEQQTHDHSFVKGLFDEHKCIVSALVRLLDPRHIDDAEIMRLRAALDEGLEHAEHCGTLVSRLSGLDQADQAQALDELKRLRASKCTWLDL